jgi:hypothetical protein
MNNCCYVFLYWLNMIREYELLTEAHAELSVVLNCSRFSLPVYCLPPPAPTTADHPLPASCFPTPRHTRREDLEQFRTTESLAWASVINSYSLNMMYLIVVAAKLLVVVVHLHPRSSPGSNRRHLWAEPGIRYFSADYGIMCGPNVALKISPRHL